MKNLQIQIDVDVTTDGTYPAAAVGSNAAALPFENIYGFSAILKSLAAQVGSLKFQVSNDSLQTMQTNPSAAIWFDLPNSTTAVNGAAVVGLNFDALYYRWLRIKYTKTSGAGLINVFLSPKGT